MRTCASLPKPVLTPYIVCPRATAASTGARGCFHGVARLLHAAQCPGIDRDRRLAARNRDDIGNGKRPAIEREGGVVRHGPKVRRRSGYLPLRRLTDPGRPYFELETPVPVAIAVDCPARTCSSGLPGSVWKLQSKIR